MDPNANLEEQSRLLDATGNYDRRRLSELRRALQDWLATGGFAPHWQLYPVVTKAYRKWERNMAKFQDLAR